ncbi:MAG: MarR family transcriptional regulator [Hyphomicrobiales bacterium]|nr:MarR family transcriptional regulator [Hyphomicrobiales bacterium]
MGEIDAARAANGRDPLGLHDIPDGASLVHVTVERLYRLLKAQMAEALRRRGSSIVEWRILLMLRIHGEMAQKDLVNEVAMVQAQVSRTLKAMQERGLVRGRRSHRDQRVWLFTLTADGAALYRRIAPTMDARRRALDGALDGDALAGFLHGARQVAQAAAAPVNDDSDQRTTNKGG